MGVKGGESSRVESEERAVFETEIWEMEEGGRAGWSVACWVVEEEGEDGERESEPGVEGKRVVSGVKFGEWESSSVIWWRPWCLRGGKLLRELWFVSMLEVDETSEELSLSRR